MNLFQFLFLASVGVILVSSKAFETEKRLIKTSQDLPGEWLDESEILALIRANKGFMDVTDFDYSDDTPANVNLKAIPSTLRFNATVQKVIASLNTVRAQQFLRNFSDYHTRYYDSATGRASQLWLYNQVQATVAKYAGNATALEVDHGWQQKSIVARLVGANTQLRNEVVIVGGHLDSINGQGVTLRSPGADDNASGSVAVLEALRSIVDSGVIVNRTVEFHWYAAEEIGLKGSQAIAQSYKATQVNVVGMLNLDVVGYHTPGIDEVAIITDLGSPAMAQLLRILTDGYLTYGRREKTCGYACSDHASWNASGFPATSCFEPEGNPLTHTEGDTYESVNFTQINEFIKLAIGYVIEFGEPNTS